VLFTVTARWLSSPEPKRRNGADVGVQRGRLAEDVDAAQRGAVDRHLAQDVVGGDAERIVDVDDHGAARGQGPGVDFADPRVQGIRVERGERDDLGGNPERGGAPQVGHALLALGGPAVVGGVRTALAEIQAGHEIQEVLPRALATSLPEGGQLLAQDVVLVELLDERHQLGLALAGDARDDIDQAVRVRADEIERALGEPLHRQLGADRRPPAPGQPRVAGVGAAEHPYAQRQPPLADQPDALSEA
jgi:hypothetical protein